MGRLRDIASRAREITLMVLTAGIVFFAWQNLRSEEISFFFWDFQVPVALIALVPMLIGLVVGSLGTAVLVRKRSRGDREAPAPAEPAQLKPPEQVVEAEIKDEEEIPS